MKSLIFIQKIFIRLLVTITAVLCIYNWDFLFATSSSYSPYGKKLISDVSRIPKNQFRTYYIDTVSMKELATQEIMKEPYLVYWGYPNKKIKYFGKMTWEGSKYNFSGSYDIWAYWIGEFEFSSSSSTKVTFDITKVYTDKASLYIDGKLVYSVGDKKEWDWLYNHTFQKWKHIIELEYDSNSTHGIFAMKVINWGQNVLTKEKVPTIIDTLSKKEGGIDLYFASVNRSSNETSGIIDVSLPNTKMPSIIILSSDGPVMWNFNSNNLKNIKAVIIASSNGWSYTNINNSVISLYTVRGNRLMAEDNNRNIMSIKRAIGYTPNSFYNQALQDLTSIVFSKPAWKVETDNLAATSNKGSNEYPDHSSSGPWKNAMDCSNATRSWIENWVLACYGIMDYGDEFWNDSDMCENKDIIWQKLACKIKTNICKSWYAVSTLYIDPIKFSLDSQKLASIAKNLNTNIYAVRDWIMTLWEYTCYNGTNIPTFQFDKNDPAIQSLYFDDLSDSWSQSQVTGILKFHLPNWNDVPFSPDLPKKKAYEACINLIKNWMSTTKYCTWNGEIIYTAWEKVVQNSATNTQKASSVTITNTNTKTTKAIKLTQESQDNIDKILTISKKRTETMSRSGKNLFIDGLLDQLEKTTSTKSDFKLYKAKLRQKLLALKIN